MGREAEIFFSFLSLLFSYFLRFASKYQKNWEWWENGEGTEREKKKE